MCDSGGCPQEEGTPFQAAPGEDGEAAMAVEPGPTNQIHIRDTAWNQYFLWVGGTDVWICGRGGQEGGGRRRRERGKEKERGRGEGESESEREGEEEMEGESGGGEGKGEERRGRGRERERGREKGR